MSADKPWYRSFWLMTLITLLGLFTFWYVALPRVHVYYSEQGSSQLDFVWNTQNRIYRGEIRPGGVTADAGHIFPDEEFLMVLDWTASKRNHCIMINPQWPTTSIYIGADGNIDMSEGSGTDVERLSKCPWD
ncbi:hypothetical protein [Pseudomonas maioricensis]|nr:hypothetical protein [Pseudomonas sp. S25]